MENDSLLEELKKATTPVSNPLVNAGTFVPPTTGPKLEKDDFEELEPDPEEIFPAGDPPPGNEPGAGGPKTMAQFKKIAKGFVKLFETFVLKMGAKKLYPEAILQPGDAEAVVSLRNQMKMVPPSEQIDFLNSAVANDEPLRYAVARFDRVDELIKNAPLSKDEMEMLVDPLAEVIEKYKFLQVGPEANLVLALMIVMAPRIEPLFPNVMQALDKKVAERMAA